MREAFWSKNLYLLAVCLLLVLVFNTAIYSSPQSLFEIGIECICSTLVCYLLALFCLKYRITAWMLLPMMLLFWAALLVMQLRYGAILDIGILSSFIEADISEVLHYCTWGNVLAFVLAVGVISILVYGGRRFFGKNITWSGIFFVGMCSLLLNAAILAPRERQFLEVGNYKRFIVQFAVDRIKNWPVSSFGNLYVNLNFYNANKKLDSKLKSCAEPPSECFAPEDLVIVFHQGEAVRADHLSLNGYERPTTALLEQEENLITFPNTTSFGAVTAISARGIFSDAEMLERKVKYRSFVDLFDKHDFRTVGIVDSISVDVMYSRVVCREVKKNVPMSPELDRGQERSTDTLKQALAESSVGRQLYVISDFGSHDPYSYPTYAAKFTPASSDVTKMAEKRQEIINAYDNTIVDLDSAIHQNIAMLKDRPAVYLYCSDHGEALGEEGKILHGHALPCVTTPAIFIWYSDSFAALYPEKVKALQMNRNKAISHDHIFHTVLSLADIKSQLIKEELNLTNPDAGETPPPADLNIIKSAYTIDVSAP